MQTRRPCNAERLEAEIDYERTVHRATGDMVDVVFAIQGCSTESELGELAALGELTGAVEQVSQRHLHLAAATSSASEAAAVEDAYQDEARTLLAALDVELERARDRASEPRLSGRACPPPPPRFERRPGGRPGV